MFISCNRSIKQELARSLSGWVGIELNLLSSQKQFLCPIELRRLEVSFLVADAQEVTQQFRKFRKPLIAGDEAVNIIAIRKLHGDA